MKNQYRSGHHACSTIRSRKTPLAVCLAAAMAFGMAGPVMADGHVSDQQQGDLRSLLMNGQTTGSTELPMLSGRQADMAEAAMQRMLGIQTPSVVTGVTIPVSNCNNAGSGSLRAAAGLAASGDTIDMSGLNCTVQLTSSIVTSADDLTIKGNPDHKYPYISGQNTIRPLYHTGTGTLTLSGVTVEFGKIAFSSIDTRGGCIRSNGDVTLDDSAQVKYCNAENTGSKDAKGGAIYSTGVTSVLSGSIVTGGHATASSGNALGGGIYAKDGVFMKYGAVVSSTAYTDSGLFTRGGGIYSPQGMTAKYSSIGNNKASSGSSTLDAGGGAWIDGSTLISHSTIYANQADAAAALALGRSGGSTTTEIDQSTIANNTAGRSNAKYGGAVYLGNTSTLKNCTITGNVEKNPGDTKYGAGLLIDKDQSVEMSSTIVSGNTFIDTSDIVFPSDIGGDSSTPAVVIGDHNLVGITKNASVPADTIRNSSPKLGPLQDNGGVTLTTAVLKDSPAINQGTDNGYSTDQRGQGYKRHFGFGIDIGAYERGGDTIFANGFDYMVL